MKKLEEGKVERVESEFAYVRPTDPKLCKKCALSALCAMNSSQQIKMLNLVGAKEGDVVRFDVNIDELNIRFVKFLTFSLFMMLVGIFGGYLLGEKIGFQKELLSLLGGGLFLFFVYLVYKKFENKEEKIPKIVEIEKEE